MNAVVIGCGRVGSAVAKGLAADGWEVTVLDESEDALARLGPNWRGGFVIGHGMDTNVLERAGIAEADAAVVATSGDNTNVVIGQVLQRRYGTRTVVVRVLDPARAKFYAERGLNTVCPTQTAISVLLETVQASVPRAAGGLMYVIVAGGGKVGRTSRARCIEMGHEITLIEQRPDRFARLEEEFGPVVLRGDATEISVLERAGIARPPELLLAVTGDDEDNLVISQIGKEGYGVPKAIASVNDPRNQAHFDLLGIKQTVCATTSILGLVEHEVPEHGLVRLLQLQRRGSRSSRCRSSPTPRRRFAGRWAHAARGIAADLGLPPRPHRAGRAEHGHATGRPGARRRLGRLGVGAAQGAPRAARRTRLA